MPQNVTVIKDLGYVVLDYSFSSEWNKFSIYDTSIYIKKEDMKQFLIDSAEIMFLLCS